MKGERFFCDFADKFEKKSYSPFGFIQIFEEFCEKEKVESACSPTV